MNEELKPCPYCGGNGVVGYMCGNILNKICDWFVWCEKCGATNINQMQTFSTEAEAVDAWNTRYVETCDNIGEYHNVDQFVCSKCGIWLEDWVRVEFDEEENDHVGFEYTLKYCPDCGRKIV